FYAVYNAEVFHAVRDAAELFQRFDNRTVRDAELLDRDDRSQNIFIVMGASQKNVVDIDQLRIFKKDASVFDIRVRPSFPGEVLDFGRTAVSIQKRFLLRVENDHIRSVQIIQ